MRTKCTASKSRPHCALMVCLALVGNSANASDVPAILPRPDKTPPSSGKVKVYILAGQSNMEGQGVVAYDHPKHYNGGKGNLVWSMKNSKSAAPVSYTHLTLPTIYSV